MDTNKTDSVHSSDYSVHSVQNSTIEIAPASLDELPIALALLNASAQWLLGKGIQQWQTPLPENFITFMQDEARLSHVYLARAGQGGSAIATLRIAHQDIPRWKDDGSDNALYVYSLAIRNDLHGAGIGAQLLDAIREMAQQQQKQWLRLDCWARNDTLQAYYKSHGFSQAGEVDDAGFPLVLFQVRLSSDKHQLV